MAGISKPQIYRWLKGENRPENAALRRLGKALERDVPHAGVGVRDLMVAAGYEEEYAPTVRVSGMSASADLDADLASWIDKARRNHVDLEEWNLADPLEREIFVHPTFNWREKSGMHMSLRAYMAEARERHRREQENGAPRN